MNENIFYRIWRLIYPLIIYFALNMIILWIADMIVVPTGMYDSNSFVGRNYRTIASVIYLAISIIILLYMYRRDENEHSSWLPRHPAYLALILVTGAIASHGLSALVSLIIPADIIGSYNEIQDSIFTAAPWLVVIQTVVLAPVSEEILFRGLLFKRMEAHSGNSLVCALISSAVFGLYHMDISQGIFAFGFGLLCCAVYYSMENLWASIILHAGGNLLSVILIFTGFDYSSKAVYITVMCVCLAGAAAIYYFLIRPKKEEVRNV